MKLDEIRKFAEQLDTAEACFMYGYLKGFHNIKDDEE